MYTEDRLKEEEQADVDLELSSCEVIPCSHSLRGVSLDEQTLARLCWPVSVVGLISIHSEEPSGESIWKAKR